jgi:hypothetical protein
MVALEFKEARDFGDAKGRSGLNASTEVPAIVSLMSRQAACEQKRQAQNETFLSPSDGRKAVLATGFCVPGCRVAQKTAENREFAKII